MLIVSSMSLIALFSLINRLLLVTCPFYIKLAFNLNSIVAQTISAKIIKVMIKLSLFKYLGVFF